MVDAYDGHTTPLLQMIVELYVTVLGASLLQHHAWRCTKSHKEGSIVL